MNMKGAYNIIFIIACYFIVNGIYIPAMPNTAEYFSVSGETIRTTMAYFQFGAFIMCIIAGFFADGVGKKNFLLLGLGIAIIGSIICLESSSVTQLMIGRFLQGVGAATGFMMGFALAVDLYKPDETLKIIALNGIIVSIISVIIPYIGGNLTHVWNWRATFIFIIPLFFIALISSIKFFPKEANIQTPLDLRKGLLDYAKLLTSKTYVCYAMLNAIFLGAFIFSLSYLPFFYKNSLHLEENIIGLLIGTIIFFPFGLCSIYSVRLYRRFDIDRSIYIGLFICFIGAAIVTITAYTFQESILLNLLGTFIYYGGFGILYSGSISKSLSIYMDLTTKASALRTIMISFLSFIGGFVAQFASDGNLMHYAIVLLFATVLSTLFFLFRGRTS
jgi:MFS family permease